MKREPCKGKHLGQRFEHDFRCVRCGIILGPDTEYEREFLYVCCQCLAIHSLVAGELKPQDWPECCTRGIQRGPPVQPWGCAADAYKPTALTENL